MPPLFNLAPSANAALPPHPRLQTSYPPFAHFYLLPLPLTTASCFWLSFYASCFLSAPDSLRVLQWNAGVFEPGTLNCYTFFRTTTLTLFVSRILILTHLALSGSLDSLIFDLITPTSDLALSLTMPLT